MTPAQQSTMANPFQMTDHDVYLFNEGSHFRLYEKMGAHPIIENGIWKGVSFAVWAPNADSVSVMGDFNNWNRKGNPLESHSGSGIWTGVVEGLKQGDTYKYFIRSRHNGYKVEKADPFAFHYETPPQTGSKIWAIDGHDWQDQEWMAKRHRSNSLQSPISIYELHLGSWRRCPEDGNRSLSYREIAPQLAEYVKKMNFTHVELLPITEHPFYGSWGYQVTGFFAPTSRYGTPEDLMYLIDYLHQHDIGVILDWVPSHFPTDEHGLRYFDGTHLYEHADPRQGFHQDWGSAVFNYGRHEVRSFLISSGLFWLDKFHIDGLRVDAVASMLYLDYSRKEGEWIPNQYGGRENIDAIEFLRRFNAEVYQSFPDVQTIAEESTSWPMVSRPNYLGGLGFGLKWDMGWMHDTLEYMQKEPVFRRFHHNNLTFRMLYAFTENFCLSLSHDEVVYGKRSLMGKMPGDTWQKCANLRLLFGYMYAQAGKKLIFMGGEIGQWNEWNHESSLDWHLLEWEEHVGIARWMEDLNRFYREEPAFHELDTDPAGFEWIDANDSDQSVITLLRRGKNPNVELLVACNFTPVPRENYRVGAPHSGYWEEVLNSDAEIYGGSGMGNWGGVETVPIRYHGRNQSVSLTLPPLSMVLFRWNGTSSG